jgi:precorrin-6Y C5,15-methyltransferase (decarboxylating)
VINKVDETMEFIRSSLDSLSSPIVLLASGDPLFFGIGRRAVSEFGHERVEILPDLSSIQMAFARLGEPWDNALLMSLHGGPDPEKRRRLPYELGDIPALLEQYGKIAVLTDKENNPSAIAAFLHASPITCQSSPAMHVCERLGYPEEKITSGTPEEIAGLSFAEPNVVIIMHETASSASFPLVGNLSGEVDKKDCGQAAMTSEITFGLKEDEISHSRGLITKDEVRAVSIHKLRLPRKGIFWDIGAGSGSVSVESARLFPLLKVYAVEKNEEQTANIGKNIDRFRLSNVAVISGMAPDILKDLPPPDRVFIGGSRGRLSGIIGCIAERMLKGVIVLNATTLETLNEATLLLEKYGLDPEVSQVSVSRSKIVGGQRHMAALNPIFIITGEKK